MIVLATLGDSLGDALAQIATVLRVPVLIAAIVVLVAGAFEVGRYGAELWRRWRRGREMELSQLVRHAAADPAHVAHYAYYAPSAFAEAALRGIVEAVTNGRPAEMEQALVAYELAVQRRLDRTRILVRAGPAIGLMGTLIPLAPGLAALGDGDVSELAGDLRDALAATVIGLLVGTVAFALTLTRTRMYTEDLAALERAAEALRRDVFPVAAAPAPMAGAAR
ncbi:MAG TPA: MotA/TolQ/ExbB proton channel family protein [Solirubrobacterales bacterium]|nr:MotA/TolQ/ExbB proton channel family protein [Solirubrobacterales bacterium]